MKRLLQLAFLLAFIPSFSFAQTAWGDPNDNKLNSDELNGPKLVWVQDSYDLGDVKQGEPVTVIYEFKNTGNKPLIILNVEPACDCTAAEWPKTPILPGQASKIVIEYDAKSKGKFSKTAVVKTNAKPTETSIIFTGTVVQ